MKLDLQKQFNNETDLKFYLYGIIGHFNKHSWGYRLEKSNQGNMLELRLTNDPVTIVVVYEKRRGFQNQYKWFLNDKAPKDSYRYVSHLHISEIKIGGKL